MNALEQYAAAQTTINYPLPSGRVASIRSLAVRFPPAVPPRMETGLLTSTYTTKPLVDVEGEPVFGELAIVRWLAKDRWSALWVDTFHGRKFWRGMPHRTSPVEPPAMVRELYDRIAKIKGTPSGCFDVVAWKDRQMIWLEYKGPSDKPNKNEAPWIDAALQAGVSEQDLFFVGDR